MKRFAVLLGTSCLAVFMLSTWLFAGISVEPTVTEKVLSPGATEEGTYKLANTGPKPLEVSVEVEDWMQRLFGIQDSVPVSDWLSLEPKKITLKPGQKTRIKYRVKAPVQFLNEKVAQVFFSFSENPNLTSRLGVIFYLSPKGEEKLQAEITQFNAQCTETKDKKPELLVWFRIKNASNVHIRPMGSVSVFEAGKQTLLKELAMNRVPGIYPGKTFSWTHSYDLGNVLGGSYTAKLVLDYGHTYGKKTFMEKTADFRCEGSAKTG